MMDDLKYTFIQFEGFTTSCHHNTMEIQKGIMPFRTHHNTIEIQWNNMQFNLWGLIISNVDIASVDSGKIQKDKTCLPLLLF